MDNNYCTQKEILTGQYVCRKVTGPVTGLCWTHATGTFPTGLLLGPLLGSVLGPCMGLTKRHLAAIPRTMYYFFVN